jgi:hypothetical protein
MAPFELFQGISTRGATALADFNSKVFAFHSISCASLRLGAIDALQLLRGAYPTRIVGS